MPRTRIPLALAAVLGLLLAARAVEDAQDSAPPARAAAVDSGCVACHAGIEDMHPKEHLSCTACHGGDGSAATKDAAHVKPRRSEPGDERVAPRDDDLAWRRFQNPMDLRVAMETCGGCHAEEVSRVHTSLHATTAGHLSDGFYEVGLLKEKGSRYSVFPQAADASQKVDVAALEQVPAFNERLPRDKLSTHFMDLTRKECAQCHLWSNGRAVRGRVGFDGDYRGEGCAACHVAYGLDGHSRSADAKAVRNEPGHALRHALTRAPTTATCTACHNGDASIGLSFQGLAQLPPGAPGGPEIPGTTDALRHRAFYIDDPAVTPPDVHHERGMHCIDCHTENDVMGDGSLHGAMEHAVEISCQDCHGTFTAPATLRTQDGTRLAHVERDTSGTWLTSKVDGSRHRVVQVVDVLQHGADDYNERATAAMTSAHTKLECYTCHAGWNANFLGFHFDRNESLSQLDLLSGKRTAGRVTTQEKIFATWKSFYAGFNESGRIAPYLTGFSTMGTVRGEDGELVLDQVLPETAAKLSGMTMIHHQVHTTRPTARSCAECHRSSATWGMGSPNFRLSRQLAFVAERRGVEAVALDRSLLQASLPIAKVVVPRVIALAVDSDPLQGHARYVYAAEESRGVHVLDFRDPTAPVRAGFVASSDPRALELCGDFLLCAGGAGGLEIYDVKEPAEIALASRLPTLDARGIDLAWPHAYVADGAGGLLVVDVRDPASPRAVGGLALEGPRGPAESISVSVLFQNSRPTLLRDQPADDRTQARMLCAVLDAVRGPELVDATEPTEPFKLWPPRYLDDAKKKSNFGEEWRWRAIALRSHVDVAQAQGGTRTQERDLAYFSAQRPEGGGNRTRLWVFDVTNPIKARGLGDVDLGNITRGFTLASVYQPPFLSRLVFVGSGDGVQVGDWSISVEPRRLGFLSGLNNAAAIAFEEFALDRSLTEQGVPQKDVSHAGSRWLGLAEIARVLDVPASKLDFETRPEFPEIPGATSRLHLAKLDLDGSGFLDGAEYERGGGAGADFDRDGRVSLAELVRLAQRDGQETTEVPMPEVMAPMPRGAQATRLPPALEPDGEYACVLDTVRPRAFDGDGGGELDPAEFARALFAALDLDGDKSVSLDELSRLPGETRELRFRGARAAQVAKTHDKNGDGKVGPKEWRGGSEIFKELDLDGSGKLAYTRAVDEKRGGKMPEGTLEWPARQRYVESLPPVTTREKVLAAFDADKDGTLTPKELKSRPDLLAERDYTGDGKVEPMELQAGLDRVGSEGVNATLDGFLERWDLNRDGKVTKEEFPIAVRR